MIAYLVHCCQHSNQYAITSRSPAEAKNLVLHIRKAQVHPE